MKTFPLGELCTVTIGRTPPRADERYWGPGAPWVSIADMAQGALITTTKEQITEAGAAKGKQVAPGTVLMSFKLSIGKVAIAGMPLYTNEAIAALAIKDPSRLDERFLLRALEAMNLAQSANRAAMGATLNTGKLNAIQVPVPAFDEQRRIAAILDHADALRAKRRQVLAHLDSLTQSVFHQMFTDGAERRVPASEVMPSMRNGVSPATAGRVDATVLTLSAITRGGFDPKAATVRQFVAEPGIDKRVTAKDFLMCRGNGNKSLVGVGIHSPVDRPDLVFPDTVIAGRVDQAKIAMPYLETAWKQRAVRQQIEAIARTTNGTFKVNQQTLAGVELELPPMERQLAFAEKAERVHAQRAKTASALNELDRLFASLQSRAFSRQL